MNKEKIEEFRRLMADPEFQEAMNGDKLSVIKKPIKVTDDMTIQDVVREYEQKMAAMLDHFESKMNTVKGEAIQEATKKDRDAEAEKVRKFIADHPELDKNKDLFNTVDKLYIAGFDLTEAYELGAKKHNITTEKKETETPPVGEVTPEAKETKISSLRSDTGSVVPKGEASSKPEGERSMRDIISANLNDAFAKAGMTTG